MNVIQYRGYKIKMSKDYTQKIRNLLNTSTHTVPYIFQRFYSVVKSITLSLRHNQNDPKIFQQYSLIYRTLKKYVHDEPSLALVNSDKIDKELKVLINPLLIYLRDDMLAKKLLSFFIDKEVVQKVGRFIEESDKLKTELLAKNLKLKVFGTHEMANAFWIQKFKNQYAVHVDTFWNSFLQFVQEIDFFEYFISVSSKKSIMRKVDPQKKYFVASSNVTQLFYKLSQPDFLQKLADQTAKGVKPVNFMSKDFLEMKFLPKEQTVFETDLRKNEMFEISGQDTMIEGKRHITKHPPTIIFGSSVDSDIKIKNKYVSRKQFMVIEQEDEKVTSSKENLPFSLVCLSSSNFTMVKYDREVRLGVGMIFRVGENAVQVVKLENCIREIAKKQEKQVGSDEEDETLEYLPTKSSLQMLQQKQLYYLCISGPQKGHKGTLNQSNKTLSLQKQQQQEQNDRVQMIYKNNDFFLPPGVRVFVKTANQVINGELSDKLPLEQGMRVVLEECQFQIV